MNFELLKQLVEAFGPSGFEGRVAAIIRTEVESYVDDISVDALGNLIAVKRGGGDGLRIMVAAHMDEIGVMVTHITEEGFLRFTNVGFVFSSTIMGNRVQFEDGTQGVVYSDTSSDVLTRKEILPLEKHFIDIGAASRDTCPIPVGAPGAFKRELLVQGSRLTAKSMDDRIGCYVVIEALKKISDTPHEIHLVFSVQEEVGTRGALAAANGILPDVGIAVDVTPTGDLPGSVAMDVSLGDGPAIKVKDSGMIAHTGLVRAMRKIADEAAIPYQLEVLLRGSTDARSIQIAGPGSAAGCISIPSRYVHTTSETVDASDVQGAVDLLAALLSKPLEL
jgi:tetrahedral aminopeptidase